MARHSANQLGTRFGVQLLMTIALGEAPEQIAQMAADIAGAGDMARFSRDDEREADDYGVSYTSGAGYDPNGLITLFAKMARIDGGSGTSIDRLLASHPATDERHAERYREMTRSLR